MDALALVVALVALILAVTGLVVAVRGRPGQVSRGPSPTTPAPRVKADVGNLPGDTWTSATDSRATALRHVSVVRYDAFDDVAGRLSFTAAILDDRGEGLVITSLHARTESRTYLKGVPPGRGEKLSPEEQQAVDHARGGS